MGSIKNKLDTGTITFSDIENKAEYSASNIGVGIDTRPVKDPKNPNSSGVEKKDAGVTPSISGTDGKDDSKTKSAVAEGTIEVKDKENQKQDVEDLSRDTKNANDKLDKIFDKDKILTQQELAKVFGEVGFTLVGQIKSSNKWTNDDPRSIAMHAVIGGIMSQLNGGSFVEGMSVAAINKLVIAELGKMKDGEGKNLFTGAELRWISATVGATVSKAVGGNAGQGAGIADSATKNNYLTQQQYDQMVADTKRDRAALAEAQILSKEQDQVWYNDHKNEEPIAYANDGKAIYELHEVGVDPGTGNKVYLSADGVKVITGTWHASANMKSKVYNADITRLGTGEFYVFSEAITINGIQAQVTTLLNSNGEVFSSTSIGYSGKNSLPISIAEGRGSFYNIGLEGNIDLITKTKIADFTGASFVVGASSNLVGGSVSIGDYGLSRIMVVKGLDSSGKPAEIGFSGAFSVTEYIGDIKEYRK